MKIEFKATLRVDPVAVKDLSKLQEALYSSGVPEDASVMVRSLDRSGGMFMIARWVVEVVDQ